MTTYSAPGPGVDCVRVPWFVKCQRALNPYWAANGAPVAS